MSDSQKIDELYRWANALVASALLIAGLTFLGLVIYGLWQISTMVSRAWKASR